MLKNILLTLTFIYVIIASFLLFPAELEEETIHHPTAKIDLESLYNKAMANEEYETYQINDRYTNIYNENKSIFFDTTTGEEINIATIITDTTNFSDIEQTQLKIKYPTFIIAGLNNTTGEKRMTFSKNGLKIQYINYSYSPQMQINPEITISCAYLKTLTDCNCQNNAQTDINVPVLDSSKPTIALTFDDGPNGNTIKVIEALTNNKASATFFMLGQNMEAYPSTVKKVYESGFEIASHTYNHARLTSLSKEKRVEQLTKTNAIYNKITGDNIKLTRAPYGSLNQKIITSHNTTFVGWSIDTRDWEHRNVEKTVESILSAKDGDIVLLHDIHAKTAEAVIEALPLLYAKGYQVVGVSELAQLKNQTIQMNTIVYSFK